MHESQNNTWQPQQDVNLLKNIDSSYEYIEEYLNNLQLPDDLTYAKQRLLTLVQQKKEFKFNRPFQLWVAVKFLEGLANKPNDNQAITGVLDLATGSGKTYTFLLLVCILVASNSQSDSQSPQKFNNTLVVVPTTLLQNQTIEKWNNVFKAYQKLLQLKPMQADSFAPNSKAKLQVTCQQTLSMINNENPSSGAKIQHLKQFVSKSTFIVFDEAHLTYRKNMVNCLKTNNGMTMLAVSATAAYQCGPITSVYDEGKKFGSVMQLPVLDLESASRHNIISSIFLTKCHLPITSQAIIEAPKDKDYEAKDIGNALDKTAYFDAICEIYAKEGRPMNNQDDIDYFFNRKTIIFCTTIDVAEHLCARFNYWYEQKWKDTLKKSFSKFAITATSENDVKTSSQQFSAGKFRVLIGVRGLITGADLDGVRTIIDNAPTKYTHVSLQKLGRGTRAGKKKSHVNYIQMLYFPSQDSFQDVPGLGSMTINTSGELTINRRAFKDHPSCGLPYTLQFQPETELDASISLSLMNSYTKISANTVASLITDGIDLNTVALEKAYQSLNAFLNELKSSIQGSFPRKRPAKAQQATSSTEDNSSSCESPDLTSVQSNNESPIDQIFRKIQSVSRSIIMKLTIPSFLRDRQSRNGSQHAPQPVAAQSLQSIIKRLERIVAPGNTDTPAGDRSDVQKIIASSLAVLGGLKTNKQSLVEHINKAIQASQPKNIDSIINSLNDGKFDEIKNIALEIRNGLAMSQSKYHERKDDLLGAVTTLAAALDVNNTDNLDALISLLLAFKDLKIAKPGYLAKLHGMLSTLRSDAPSQNSLKNFKDHLEIGNNSVTPNDICLAFSDNIPVIQSLLAKHSDTSQKTLVTGLASQAKLPKICIIQKYNLGENLYVFENWDTFLNDELTLILKTNIDDNIRQKAIDLQIQVFDPSEEQRQQLDSLLQKYNHSEDNAMSDSESEASIAIDPSSQPASPELTCNTPPIQKRKSTSDDASHRDKRARKAGAPADLTHVAEQDNAPSRNISSNSDSSLVLMEDSDEESAPSCNNDEDLNSSNHVQIDNVMFFQSSHPISNDSNISSSSDGDLKAANALVNMRTRKKRI